MTIEQPTLAIQQMLDATDSVIARRYRTLRNLVIAQNSTLLCARTYNSNAANENNRTPESIAPIMSVTKSIIGLLTGIAIAQKIIPDVDQTIASLLRSKSEILNNCPMVAGLTLHQLLSMTSGFQWRGGRAAMEPLAGRMIRQADWIDFALSLPVRNDDIGTFLYNSAVSHLISAIIQECTDESTASFANKHLFAPLGITEYEWQTDPAGINIGGWGLSLSPISLARIGDLCLNHGVHNGQQLVSRHWINQMWTAHSQAKSLHAKNQPADFFDARYGYQWWIRGNDETQVYCAEGAGGQAIYCLPDLNATIIVTADYTRRAISLWPLFEQYWLPAIAKSTAA